MPCKVRTARGFTLVELLAVIAIIALLVSLLVPFVGRAKGLAMRAQCQNNLKLIGHYTHAFASMHGGRAPGRAWGYTYGDPTRQPRGRGWVGFLNVEVIGQRRYWVSNPGAIIVNQQSFSADRPKPPRGVITCPSMVFYARQWPRAFQFNRDAAGGANWGGEPYWGPYGIQVDPPPPPLPDDLVGSQWVEYGLGAILVNFPNPTQQFLVVESEYGNDQIHASWPAAWPHTVPVNDGNPDYPPYSGIAGLFAFRHALPLDPELYQSQATGNFLYIDGHVDCLTPNDKINAYDRFDYRSR